MSKRTRSANFSREECHRLLYYVNKHLKVIENKSQDAITWREKDAEWALIAEEFNAGALVIRTGDQLRQKYDCLKKALRQEAGRDQLSQYRLTPLKQGAPDDLLDKVRSIVTHTTEVAEGQPIKREDSSGCEDADEGDISLGLSFDASMHESAPLVGLHRSSSLKSVPPVAAPVSCTVTHSPGSTAGTSESNGTDDGSWHDYTQAVLHRRRMQLQANNNNNNGEPQEQWARKQPLVAGAAKSSLLVQATREFTSLQSEVLYMEHEAREKRLDEYHDIQMRIKEAELEAVLLDIELKKKQLKQA